MKTPFAPCAKKTSCPVSKAGYCDGKGDIDDIDHPETVVRSVGEPEENQYRVGSLRMSAPSWWNVIC
jgi:hypothetical protein